MPSDAVGQVLSRVDDPERKVDLVVLSETNEARHRNRLMDLASPRGASRRVALQHDGDHERPEVDYFLILDADEAWAPDDLERLRAHAAKRRLPFYRAASQPYFQRWRWRIDRLEWLTVLVRADHRTYRLRNPRLSLLRRAASRAVRPVATNLASRILQVEDVDAAVTRFHHASYVGPRARVERKLAASGHADEMFPNWLTTVYDRWDPERSRDFHPRRPELYPSVTRVDDEELPRAVREHPWPPGYFS
jgi:hypothetical protein